MPEPAPVMTATLLVKFSINKISVEVYPVIVSYVIAVLWIC